MEARSSAAQIEKRSPHLSDQHRQQLSQMGVAGYGINDCTNNGNVWLGKDGSTTNTFYNHAGEDIILIIWSGEGSWVNVHNPDVAVSMKKGHHHTVSFADGISGGWAAIYKDTVLENGLVKQTWGEYTMGEWGTIDVSREVWMKGRNMRIHTPNCVSDMDKCVFVCPDGQDTCWQQYELHNCDNGSQGGATYGTYGGMPSGGCGNFGSSPHLRTIFE